MLRGQQAVVSGGARGIGRAVSEALAREGARVAILSRDVVAARAAAASLPRADDLDGEGNGHMGIACDITCASSRTAAVSSLTAAGILSSVCVSLSLSLAASMRWWLAFFLQKRLCVFL